MLEVGQQKKHKVSLLDYPCERDVRNRMLLAEFTIFDLEVLEEILFSPLKISLKKLSRQVGRTESDLSGLIHKLSEAHLLTVQGDQLLVDKEMRKYFELEVVRFQADFRPNLEFIQEILRKVPIHLLPSWYSIPRTSNNIFESIVEKYLNSPQIYQRYFVDLTFPPPISSIIEDLFRSPNFVLSVDELLARYNLERRKFEETLLLLEFHFICCMRYVKEGDRWKGIITPFHEWHQYLLFLQQTEPAVIEQGSAIENPSDDFTFVDHLSETLASISAKPKPLEHLPDPKIVEKLCLTQLAREVGGKLSVLGSSTEWLEMSRENKALYLYRHPCNRLNEAYAQAQVREAEKTVKRVLHGGWVFFEDFFKGVHVTLSEHSVAAIKKTGKHWAYTLPRYSDKEKALVHATIFEWLYQAGMVKTGTCQGRDCFALTSFGRFFFEE